MSNYELNCVGLAAGGDDLLLECPTCGLPAEVADRFTLEGSPAPVEHVKLVCVARHWFTLPAAWLPGGRERSIAPDGRFDPERANWARRPRTTPSASSRVDTID